MAVIESTHASTGNCSHSPHLHPPHHSSVTVFTPPPPLCKNDLPLTVDHFFDYPLLTSIRDSCHVPYNPITALIHHSISLSNIFSYLHHTNFLLHILTLPLLPPRSYPFQWKNLHSQGNKLAQIKKDRLNGRH